MLTASERTNEWLMMNKYLYFRSCVLLLIDLFRRWQDQEYYNQKVCLCVCVSFMMIHNTRKYTIGGVAG